MRGDHIAQQVHSTRESRHRTRQAWQQIPPVDAKDSIAPVGGATPLRTVSQQARREAFERKVEDTSGAQGESAATLCAAASNISGAASHISTEKQRRRFLEACQRVRKTNTKTVALLECTALG